MQPAHSTAEAIMAVDPKIVGAELAPIEYAWDQDTLILYALGAGVGVDDDQTKPSVLQYTYENGLKALPTFGVVPPFPVLIGLMNLPGFQVNPMMILHGEQYLEVLQRPIPLQAKVITRGKVKALYDKGKGALLVADVTTYAEDGTPLFRNEFGIFARGEGGFGGESGPAPGNEAPNRAPDAVVEYPVMRQQALLYRLSGDKNPLHADPQFAAMGGFDKPILHGLCTFANVGRAVIEACAGDDPTRFKSIKARFTRPIMPGDTIVTEMWKESDKDILVQAKAKSTGAAIMSNSRVTLD
jgi:(3R)-3-hydroxyacyl-CoA dehydrogenase / 3a,7a,12a-trihydroxy-5b-cholest-24-enoyl-CoA hydratase / enoyl-CoA hydratase 2